MKEIDSLLRLLDDPDPVVHEAVVGRLSEIGTAATVELRGIVEGRRDEYSLLREAAGDALTEIGLRRMFTELGRAGEQGADSAGTDSPDPEDAPFDLGAGAFAVAMHRYPDLDTEEYISQLDEMADLLRWRTRDFDRGIDIVREINYFLVQEQRWRGVAQNRYHDPDSSCLNRVIDLRRGIPVTMTTVWLLLAQRLGLPLQGIGFPVHFLARYKGESEDFMIDPFNGGVVVTEEQCKAFLDSVGLQFDPSYLEPVGGRYIVARIMRNLSEIYRGTQQRLAEGMDAGVRLIAPGEEGLGE